MEENNSALFFMYGLPQEVMNKIDTKGRYNSLKDFTDPDVCEACGGRVKWSRQALRKMKQKGVCQNCGHEVKING